MTFALPSLLSNTNNWGAFVFFAAWCAGGLLYVHLLVPEIAGRTVEEIEHIFNGPIIVSSWRAKRRENDSIIEGQDDLSQKA